MKLSLKASAAGLLLGILLIFILQPELNSPAGMALLLLICVLVANCTLWVVQLFLGRSK